MSDSAPSPIRLVLLERYALVRAGLRALIERVPGLCVVGEAGQAADALAVVAREQPDVILFEPNVTDDNECELIPQLLESAAQARLLLITGSAEARLHWQAVQLGATGIVLKDEPIEILGKAISKVYAGEAWLDRSMMAEVITHFSQGKKTPTETPEQNRIASLSQREREVIALIGKGLKNKELADQMSISEFTVRHHLTSIFTKLQVADRLELIIFAYRHGLADLPK
ncbi:MAG: response regulator transcription factor [Anaerolineales bacterium]|nr:response regulator transcription factor [Anaerolineales bacterium]